MVTTAGSASGTTATARATPKTSISMIGCAAQQAEADDDGHDDDQRRAQRPPDLVEVLLQGRFGALDRLQHPRDFAELGLHAGGDDDAPARGHRSTAVPA